MEPLGSEGKRQDLTLVLRLFGSLKAERLHGQRFMMRRQAKEDAIAWILWYNRTRLATLDAGICQSDAI